MPAGVEAVWAVLSPWGMDGRQERVKRICVGAIYIAPRSPYKEETITHIMATIHMIRARYDNEVHFLMAGDYNRVNIQDILLRYGALQQICGVPTRKGATLQLILTDLHTYMYPPTAHPPIQVDKGKKGKDADHQGGRTGSRMFIETIAGTTIHTIEDTSNKEDPHLYNHISNPLYNQLHKYMAI